MEEALKGMIEYTNNMLTAPVLTQENNRQTRVSKNMVSDPG